MPGAVPRFETSIPRRSLGENSRPTLVIAGDRDVSTPWEGHSQVLAANISDAQAVRLEQRRIFESGASAVIYRPRYSISAARNRIRRLSPGGWIRGSPGCAGRCACGSVDRRSHRADPDFQNLITRYAWGTVWTRPGLSRRTRRLLTLAIAASLGRWEEFRLHVRAGLEHELERCDLKETLLQTAIYAGVPAANTGFQIASEEIEKLKTG